MLVDKSSKNKENKEKLLTDPLFLELHSLQGNDVTSSKSCDIWRFERSNSKGWTDVTEISFMLLHIKCITINGMLSRSQESMSY